MNGRNGTSTDTRTSLYALNRSASISRIDSGSEDSIVLSVSFIEILRSYRLDGLWLDVGCGTGQAMRKLEPEAIGIDYVLENCARYSMMNHSVVRSDANTTLPFKNDSFAGILCSHTLEHLESPLNSLREMRRVIAPGGLLVLCLPTYRSIVRWHLDDYFDDHRSHVYSFDVKSIKRLLELAEFRIVETKIDLPRSHRFIVILWLQTLLNTLPWHFLRLSNAFWIVARATS